MSYICKQCETEVITEERAHSTRLCWRCRRGLCWTLGEHIWAPTLTGKTWCTRCDIDFNKETHGTHGEYHNRYIQETKEY